MADPISFLHYDSPEDYAKSFSIDIQQWNTCTKEFRSITAWRQVVEGDILEVNPNLLSGTLKADDVDVTYYSCFKEDSTGNLLPVDCEQPAPISVDLNWMSFGPMDTVRDFQQTPGRCGDSVRFGAFIRSATAAGGIFEGDVAIMDSPASDWAYISRGSTMFRGCW
jgi:hypothetical protein